MKKAETSAKFVAAILILLVSVLFLNVFTGVAADFSSLFFPDTDEAALRNFEVLKETTNFLLMQPVKNKAVTTPFALKGKYMVVGYDPDFVEKVISEANLGKFVRPYDDCKDEACLCLYKKIGKENNALSGEILECYTFGDDVIFYSEDALGENIIGGKSKDMGFKINNKRYYEHFIIFGNKKNPVESFGSRNVYVEKREIDEKYYIYISDYNKEIIEDRGLY